MKKKILKAWKEIIAETGSRPDGFAELAEKSGFPEEEILSKFPSIPALDLAVWSDFFQRALERTEEEKVYADYSTREKLLSFYFTLIETLKENEAAAKFYLHEIGWYEVNPHALIAFFKHFEEWAAALLTAAMESGEIPRRPMVSDRYAWMLGWQMLWVLRTWRDDTSEQYQQTDEAIEKAVNLGFDGMERNFLDSGFEFAKFWYSKTF